MRLLPGRVDDLRDLVAALLWPAPEPVPVLGPAGVGRSMLVREAFNDPRVAARFGSRRYFVRCDGVRNTDALLIEIGRAFDLEPWGLEDRLFEELGLGPAALALSGLEEPWRSEPTSVEALLSRLASVPGLALVATLPDEPPLPAVTWRGAIRVEPFSRTAAVQTFLDLAGQQFRNDPLLQGLLEAVDLQPLAIVLLAHAAKGEPDLQEIWQRWLEHRDRRAARLRWKGAREWGIHIEIPLEVALAGRRVTPEARRLLALLADLPDGVRPVDLDLLLPGHGEKAAAALQATGLAFEERGRIRVLGPIRKAMRQEHPPLEADLDRAVSLFLERGAAAEWTEEPGNVHSMILLGLEGRDPEPAIRSAIGLGDLLRSLGWGSGHSSELERAKEVSSEIGRYDLAALCSAMLAQLARSCPRASGSNTARERFEEALYHYRQAGDVHGEALCLRSLGDLALEASDPATARLRFEDALPLFRLIRDPRGEAHCLRRLADAEVECEHLDVARRRYEEALPVYRRIRDAVGEANCLRGEGDIALERSDFETARTRYAEAVSLYRKGGSLQGEAHCLRSLGDMALFQSGLHDARERYREALSLYRRVGDALGEANILQRLGDLANALSDPFAARSRYREALRLYQKIGDPYSIGLAHARLALLADEASEERRRHVQAAREVWEKIGRNDLVEMLAEV